MVKAFIDPYGKRVVIRGWMLYRHERLPYRVFTTVNDKGLVRYIHVIYNHAGIASHIRCGCMSDYDRACGHIHYVGGCDKILFLLRSYNV